MTISNANRVNIKQIDGGVTSPKGFKAAGLACGIKASGRKDIAVLVSDKICSAAAVFTTNKVAAAPVHLSKAHLANGRAQAIVVNSGVANAYTGRQGDTDAARMAEITAIEAGIDPNDVIVASTGVIGSPLPMQNIERGIKEAVSKLSTGAGSDAAEAIMTTDTFLKEYAVSFEIDGKEVIIGGTAKGSGMIAPNMATMLGFITTDAAVSPDMLDAFLKSSVEKSFNSITVDGDTSTNDMVVLLANGESGVQITKDSALVFQEALDLVCIELAKLIVRDGEGATKFIEINVLGARNNADARKAAMAIANSNLVKTAFFGEDANWGRIVAAVGYSGADVDPERIDILYGDERLIENGSIAAYDPDRVDFILKEKDIKVTVNLNLGDGSTRVWTCDFSYDYVKINAEYHT
ncbi:MAG: bifunctional glutamate N-acetyltransferase/amino-acid acetyltransferase ArgJ [Firmicutes bacterium]|nr:bifunctional glutamate N-acetyltransferase/amino-acid acetyltransferase ArgJ [Bacillota bacterium]